jgi:hypothetical protein
LLHSSAVCCVFAAVLLRACWFLLHFCRFEWSGNGLTARGP